ncbi:PaaI family thioesterase (plasmid) [Paracoccus ferrooxidans]|uniref:PaaI family thioesterase n=1 Tax=Paracoccus pantotrophus TaxID=82367 RepID=UPI000E08F4C0|nr:PaaI family thioesterase [Paracoccus pantotrophus]RDD99662.1 PaaI family thioesterase [Paracoccus pantotrophus]WGR61771.1 PaaI family thioesterase [Paracoccus ferrooxidans]WGR66100.1 PaaI family thioesterase [Paracoccus pantotrophus]
MPAELFPRPQVRESTLPAPEGWIELPSPGGFCDTFGPVHATRDGVGQFAVGFRCAERHLNPSRYCHGAALAAFTDMQAYGVQHLVGYAAAVVPTISMNIDFLSIVHLGDWVRGDIEVTRKTRNLVFAQMRCSVGDRPVMNARALFKVMAMDALADTTYFDRIGPEIERRFARIGR